MNIKTPAERKSDLVPLQAIFTRKPFCRCANGRKVYVDPDVRRYMVELVSKSRSHRQVAVGVSPRGSLALLKLRVPGRPFITGIMSFRMTSRNYPTGSCPPHHPRPQPVGCEEIGKQNHRRDCAVGFCSGFQDG
jgi:hypothetical protein